MAQPAEPPPRAIMLILGRIDAASRGMAHARKLLASYRSDRDVAIAELRVAGWTGRQVAEHIGLSVGSISNIDREQGVVTTRVARKG